MNYLKERNKMIMLLVIGFIVMMGVLFLLSRMGNGFYFASFTGLFIAFALICYPLAIVYGRSQIIDIFHSIRMGARQPFRTKKLNSPLKPLYAVLNTIIAILTIIFFGWVYGAYTAYQKLQMLKSYYVK